jgi:hypothetical protein
MKIQKLLVFLVVGLTLSAWADDAKKPVDSLLGKCPKGFWYLPQDNDGCVPEGIITEIDGVSMDDIGKVLDAHRSELNTIKGVIGHGIDRHGIFVDVTPDHDKIPADVEGLPIHTHPFTGPAVATDF